MDRPVPVPDIRLLDAIAGKDWDPGADISTFSDSAAGAGAVASFLGKLRPDEGGTPLRALTLDHYPGMAEAELARIADEALGRFDLTGVLIRHRVGEIVPHAPIVLVCTASAHRAAAFDACEFLMDWLKTRAPFWKRALMADGAAHWVDAKGSDDERAARWTTRSKS